MSASTFALDIATVKQIGVDRWRSEFSWPVSDQEFIALAWAIEARVRETIANTPGDIGAAFLIARGIPLIVEHLLHARTVVDRLRSAGATPVCAPGAQWYADVLHGQPAQRSAPVSAPVRPNWLRLAVRAVRLGRELAVNAKPPKIVARLRDGRSAWMCGSTHAFLSEQLARSPAWVATLYTDELEQATGLPATLLENLHSAAVDFVGICIRDAERLGFSCDARTTAVMCDAVAASLVNAMRVLRRMRTSVERRSITHGYLSAASNETQRAFAIAVRERGGHVTSAAHGGFVGLFSVPTPSYSEFALSDAYLTYTDGSADLCRKIRDVHPPIVPNNVAIISGASQYYRTLRQEFAEASAPRVIRTVMVIGFPQNAQRKTTAAAALGLQQLDLELRTVDVLSAAGYHVMYKAHPDRIGEIHGIFEDRAEVITEDFRTSHRLADAFLFGSMRTTAFQIALCTNKPIVALLMNEEPSSPFPDALALLARRVAIVRAKFDDRSRVMFDHHEILEALADSMDPTDSTFLDTYLATPDGLKA